MVMLGLAMMRTSHGTQIHMRWHRLATKHMKSNSEQLRGKRVKPVVTDTLVCPHAPPRTVTITIATAITVDTVIAIRIIIRSNIIMVKYCTPFTVRHDQHEHGARQARYHVHSQHRRHRLHGVYQDHGDDCDRQ